MSAVPACSTQALSRRRKIALCEIKDLDINGLKNQEIVSLSKNKRFPRFWQVEAVAWLDVTLFRAAPDFSGAAFIASKLADRLDDDGDDKSPQISGVLLFHGASRIECQRAP